MYRVQGWRVWIASLFFLGGGGGGGRGEFGHFDASGAELKVSEPRLSRVGVS